MSVNCIKGDFQLNLQGKMNKTIRVTSMGEKKEGERAKILTQSASVATFMAIVMDFCLVSDKMARTQLLWPFVNVKWVTRCTWSEKKTVRAREGNNLFICGPG